MRLLYLSPVPWTSFAQRPHEFVHWFHERTEAKVLWIEPYPTRLPTLADFRQTRARKQSTEKEIPNWLTVLKPYALPIEPLFASGWINRLFWRQLLKTVSLFMAQDKCQIAIGKPSELALQILANAPNVFSFYDAMDDFPAFYSGLSRFAMQQRERKLSKKVDKILVSSTALQSHFKHYPEKIILTLNACSVDRLPNIEELPLKPSKLVLGYVGTIGHWFDWALVCKIAKQLPQATVRLIGPLYSPAPSELPSNIEILPPCEHASAIQAMQEFSVGLIPFQCKELTASVDPIKYYEYRALGLPVISTSFGEMAMRGNEQGVFHVDESSNLNKVVEIALAYELDQEEIIAFRRANSWKARFDNTELLNKLG